MVPHPDPPLADTPDIDVAAARADTPGCASVAHFNNAGAALPSRRVTAAVIDHLRLEERVGGYEAALAVADRTDAVYTGVAGLIGADPAEVALVESASRAWDIAFHGFRLSPGDRVLVDRARYPGHAVAMLQQVARSGAVLEVVDNDDSGQLDLVDLRRRLATGPKLAALTWIPTDSGLVNPMAPAGALCRDAGVPLLVDACQAVGQLVVDVDELGCDMLTATGRKYLRAPRGTGFLYVRADRLDDIEPPTLDMSSASWDTVDTFRMCDGARRFESFEHSVATRMGLGAAVDQARALGGAAIEHRIRVTADLLRARLGATANVALDRVGVDQCGITTFTVGDVDAGTVQRRLAKQGINVSVTRPSPGGPIRPRVRASVHYYNDEHDLDTLVHAIEQMSVSR